MIQRLNEESGHEENAEADCAWAKPLTADCAPHLLTVLNIFNFIKTTPVLTCKDWEHVTIRFMHTGDVYMYIWLDLIKGEVLKAGTY